jgi:hypothetical protein
MVEKKTINEYNTRLKERAVRGARGILAGGYHLDTEDGRFVEWLSEIGEMDAEETDLFHKIFGDSPAIGQSAVLDDIRQKLGLGREEFIDFFDTLAMKYGVEVEYESVLHTAINYLHSTFTLKSLGLLSLNALDD